jgi:hypothetical protein
MAVVARPLCLALPLPRLPVIRSGDAPARRDPSLGRPAPSVDRPWSSRLDHPCKSWCARPCTSWFARPCTSRFARPCTSWVRSSLRIGAPCRLSSWTLRRYPAACSVPIPNPVPLHPSGVPASIPYALASPRILAGRFLTGPGRRAPRRVLPIPLRSVADFAPCRLSCSGPGRLLLPIPVRRFLYPGRIPILLLAYADHPLPSVGSACLRCVAPLLFLS